MKKLEMGTSLLPKSESQPTAARKTNLLLPGAMGWGTGKISGRAKTKDDAWLASNPTGDMNNYFAWFHVMEHMANHMGQIALV